MFNSFPTVLRCHIIIESFMRLKCIDFSRLFVAAVSVINVECCCVFFVVFVCVQQFRFLQSFCFVCMFECSVFFSIFRFLTVQVHLSSLLLYSHSKPKILLFVCQYVLKCIRMSIFVITKKKLCTFRFIFKLFWENKGQGLWYKIQLVFC